jgi:hypothetical protein
MASCEVDELWEKVSNHGGAAITTPKEKEQAYSYYQHKE